MSKNEDVLSRTEILLKRVNKIVAAIEAHVTDPYSPEGFYTILRRDLCRHLTFGQKKESLSTQRNGGQNLIRAVFGPWMKTEEILTAEQVVEAAIRHIPEVEYRLKQRRNGMEF